MRVVDLLLEEIIHNRDARWLTNLLNWIRDAGTEPQGSVIPRTRRLAVLAEAIDVHPRAGVIRATLAGACEHHSAVRMIAELGLPDSPSLIQEAFRRIEDALVPGLHGEDDLFYLLVHLGLTEADARWFEQLSPEALAPWREIVSPGPKRWHDAGLLLAHRATAVGLSRDLLQLDDAPESESPFFALSSAMTASFDDPTTPGARARAEAALIACRLDLHATHDRLDARGVSTGVVFRLELLDAQLERLTAVHDLNAGTGDGRAFAATLIRASIQQRGLRSLTRHSLHRLARKIVEHTGQTGEHYLVTTRRDWNERGVSAIGGGILTAFTAAFKYTITALPLAPMVTGIGIALDYSLSFITMQLAGLTLASKQPAMTAAALGGALEHHDQLDEQVELVAAITRSQVIATLGNVLSTIPMALLVDWVWHLLRGSYILDTAEAEHGLHALHPLLSLTVPFAALTGVFLWISSLVAGWTANWAAYRRLPEALSYNRRLGRFLGERHAAGFGRWVNRNLGGIVGYLSLGFLLGFTPLVFAFMGLPIEVRHVTLSAASLALTFLPLAEAGLLHWPQVVLGLCSIGLIGICNFGVSFFLALRTAMQARDLGATERARLRRALRRAFRERPARFLWLPRGGQPG